jgi:hypothetical protein
VKRIAAVLIALLLGLAVPTFAAAQLGPTNVPPGLTQTDDSDDEVAAEKDPGLSTLQLVLIFGAAIGIVAAIGFVIMRDARHAAPAAQRASAKAAAAAGLGGTPKTKSAREREREKARKRSKAKAARNQRKRNRPR